VGGYEHEFGRDERQNARGEGEQGQLTRSLLHLRIPPRATRITVPRQTPHTHTHTRTVLKRRQECEECKRERCVCA
jgi:hypothetical protein